MSDSNPNFLKVETPVPFTDSIHQWLELGQHDLDHLAKSSHRYEVSYLAWETVRKLRNPFFEVGTGFEGYLVSTCHSTDEALAAIIAVCQGMLAAIGRQYRLEYGFRSRLMKTLTGERSDDQAIYIWSTMFGMAIARLRPNLYRSRQAEAFQAETYRIVRRLPGIRYWENSHGIEQSYWLARGSWHFVTRAAINLASLKPSEQDAWLVATSIGRFGHPLVREFLAETRR